jgi:hypothetical protein
MQCGALVPIPTTEFGQLGVPEAEREAAEAAANATTQPAAAAAADSNDTPADAATTAGAAAAAAAGSTAAAPAPAAAGAAAGDSATEQSAQAGRPFNLEERMAVFDQQLIERGITGDEAVKLSSRKRAQLGRYKLRATPQQARDLLRLKADCLIIATR